MCILVNGEMQCQDYSDSDNQVFKYQYQCEQQAEFRFYGLTDYLTAYNIPYQRLEIGCEQIED